jgi:alpha(1,3/1,4) fucosyltransferase
MNFGFWNYYTYYNKNRMFTPCQSLVGDDLAYSAVITANRLRALGHDVATLDMQPLSWFDKVFFLDYPTKVNKYFRELLRLKHPNVNLILCEPPVVRPDNYKTANHAPFRQVLTWKKDLCAADPRKYAHYYIANKFQQPTPSRPFHERKLCVLINSFMFSVRPRELYSERIRAIRWFETHAARDFDLIGTEWDKPLFTGRMSAVNLYLRFFYRRIAIFKKLKVKRFPSFIGPNTVSKHLTLKAYRFCLAYENSAEPDYLSEKLFDCFFAGCVPVYAGAPNVLDLIPAGTFIDKRQFPTYEKLYEYISSMSEREYEGYLAAIDSFLRSPQMRPFIAENYVEDFIRNFAQDDPVHQGRLQT